MLSAFWSHFAQRHNGGVETKDVAGGGSVCLALALQDAMILSTWSPHPAAHTTTGPDGWGQKEWAWGAGLLLTPHRASRSIPASVLLYLTVATVSRKEERGGKVNFPPPTQICLASVVFTLPSREGGAGRSTPTQVSLPRRRAPNPGGAWAGPVWA